MRCRCRFRASLRCALLGVRGESQSRNADGSIRTLRIGESVDGWTLQSLAIDAAYFTRGGERVRVALPAE